jgi:hypothetical protein
MQSSSSFPTVKQGMFFSLSAERPFGIHFYSYFEQLYEWIIGEKTSSFRFVPGKTLLSTNTEGKLKQFSLPNA